MSPQKQKKNINIVQPMRLTSVAQQQKTTSLQVPLVNVPLSLLALARMVRDRFDVRIINAVVDADYREMVLDACDKPCALVLAA